MYQLLNKDREKVVFLNVQIEEIEDAKNMGAKWDKFYKKWYIPIGENKQNFAKWFGTTKDFFLEKSTLESPSLYLDLVPEPTWGSNLNKFLIKDDWKNIREVVYEKSNYKCEVCEGIGKKHVVEAHERWEYDDINHIQILKKISCLCPDCHRASHYGFASVIGLDKQANAKLRWINKWTLKELNEHIGNSFRKWRERNEYEWIVDVTWLKSCGIDISKKSMLKLKEDGDKLIMPSIKRK